MLRWQGSWLVWAWLLLPGIAWGQEPLLIPRADEAVTTDSPLKLSRPASDAARRIPGSSKPPVVKSPAGWGTATGSLLLVLGIIVAAGYFFARQGIRLPGMLPADVVQVLGKRYLDSRCTLQLIRCGSKILILSNSTQHGLRTLSEITDPHEVELITGQCLPTAAPTATLAASRPHPASTLRIPNERVDQGATHG